jgi:DNA invertase Pin-like site-specific DNA recombinase
MNIYGYCRISTPKQNIERQVRNIQAIDSKAVIIRETFTGTKFQGRTALDNLLKNTSQGDTIIFDSVSRMSRDAEEGFFLYEKLFNDGVNLVFLKEPHINTAVYKNAMQNQIALTGNTVDVILKGVNEYLLILAKEQIKIAFAQSEKEVQDLQQRTREGIITAKLNGKQIGNAKGAKLITKKSIEAKAKIKKYNYSFGGKFNNEETIKQIGISRMTFYKYKAELLAEPN